MALPQKAPTVFRRMDPKGKFDFYPVLTRGDEEKDILQSGEELTDFSVSLTPEAIAVGVKISTGYDAPRYADLVFAIYLTVVPAMQGSSLFNGDGLVVGVEIDFGTNMEGRREQYTAGVRVVNK